MAVRSELSLDALLNVRGLTSEDINKPCSEETLRKMAVKITRWKILRPFIYLAPEDEVKIISENSRNSKKKVAMLLMWRERFGKEATYLKLAKGFEAASWRDRTIELLDLFADNERSLRKSRAPSTPKLGDTPKPKQLITLVGKTGKEIVIRDQIADDWEQLFHCLKLEPADEDANTIYTISNNARYDIGEACREVLLMWLSGAGERKPVTWATFIQVLRDMKHDSLADEIRSELCHETC